MNSQINCEKRFFIHTLGCKVNQYESQAMREVLVSGGFKECLSKEVADIYILNTCTVTHKADKESRYWLAVFHKTNPRGRIVVTGCYSETNADDISFLPGVAHIIKNEDKYRIVDILNDSKTPNIDNKLSITDFKGHSRAFLKIQDGCENFCAYCKVPLVRGLPRSKPMNDIIREVEGLVETGFREIVLSGICLGAWGKNMVPEAITRNSGLGDPSLTDVLKALDRLSGDFRVRLSSIEPKYLSDELIDLLAGSKRMCKHLHVPLQSGDDEILGRMKRPYTSVAFKALADKIRSKIRDVAITTDVMIGFPGETEASFKRTVAFVKEILPTRTHIFTFSKRRGTAAYDMGQELKNDVLKKRYHELNTVALSASYLFRRQFLGKYMDVLVEAKRDKASGMLSGYSDNYIKIHFEGSDDLAKRIVPVKVEEIALLYTVGRL